jgi:hypothetical protein
MNLIIKHEGAAAEVFAPVLEVLTPVLNAQALALSMSADAVLITDVASFTKANDLAALLHAKEKEIEARKAYLKRPLIDVGKAIEAIIAKPFDTLAASRKSLIAKIATYDRKQKEIAEAAARKAREEAEAERQRLQKIEDDLHAIRVADAKKKAETEAAELAEIMGEVVAVEAVKVEPVAVIKVAPVVVAAPLPASSVTMRMVPTLVITDARKVAARYQVGNEILVEVNKSAVKRALESGAIIDGARIEMVEQFAQKAVR